MFKSTIWAFIGILSSQISTFIISVVLARILSPEEFGQIALLLIFVAFCDIFVNGGFAIGLIQKKDADDIDFSTITFFSLAIALLCYCLLFLLSEKIAQFFEIDSFAEKIRYLGIVIFPKMILSLQSAYCRKKFEFRKLYSITFVSNIVGGLIAIFLAKRNYGVYALINQQIIINVTASFLLCLLTDMHLMFTFSSERFKRLFDFSWKVFAVDFLIFCFQNIRSVIIGKKYPIESLGYFNKGNSYANLATLTISTTLSSVLLPYLSKEQDSVQNSKKMLRQTIQIIVLIVYPLIFGMIACAEPLIKVLLTDKWIPCVIFVQLFALCGIFSKPQVICQEALKAKGLSNRMLNIEIIRKTIEFSILIPSVFLGIRAIALSSSVACFLSWGVVAFYSQKDLSYTYKEQFSDIAPALIGSFIMGAVVFSFNYTLHISAYFLLPVQVIVGICLYALFIYFFNIPAKPLLLDKTKKLTHKYFLKHIH